MGKSRNIEEVIDLEETDNNWAIAQILLTLSEDLYNDLWYALENAKTDSTMYNYIGLGHNVNDSDELQVFYVDNDYTLHDINNVDAEVISSYCYTLI